MHSMTYGGVSLSLGAALLALLATACGSRAHEATSDSPATPALQAPAPMYITASGPADTNQFVASSNVATHPVATAVGIADLDWTDLQPKNDPNGYLSNKPIDHTGTSRMPQVGSFNTVQTLDGKRVRLPGYVVPLQTDDSGRMVEFFFVPFYGACIHVPPPPPNQMLYAKMAQPIKTPDMYTAMSIVGTLRTSKHDDALASAAYSMVDATLSVYDDSGNK